MPTYKPRTPSPELLILDCLNKRMNLSESDSQHLYTLKKGYEGEVLFDSMTEKIKSQCIILNDLRFKVNNTHIQIDTFIIFQSILGNYEVKNLEGDYFLDGDSFYTRDGTKRKNPLHQLAREDTFLSQLMKDLRCNLRLDGKVTFVNPAFTLYNCPHNQPILHPTQLKRHMDQLDKVHSQLTPYHWNLADKLISMHSTAPDFAQLPAYSYDSLRKGQCCEKCGSFAVQVVGRKLVCKICGHSEEVEAAVLRSVEELKILFPNLKLSTSIVSEWCAIIHQSTIRRILKKNFNMVGVHQWSFYE